jgi:very-short-patch-repair endonuclease
MNTDSALTLVISAAECINFASAQNSVPILRSIQIRNTSDVPAENITLELTPHPPFCRNKTWTIDRIHANSDISLSDLRLEYDFAFFDGLNEAERGQLTFRLRQNETTLGEQILPIRLLARDEWGGLGEMASILAAFVSPNDPVVAKICKRASMLLEKGGHKGALNGYQDQDPKRAYMLAAGIWSAITEKALSYAQPPASFESRGQKVRGPRRIHDEGLVTCLDSSLLFAGALEAAGLNPVIIFTKGHAFTGVWLADKTLPSIEEPDVVELRKAIAAREFVAFETTLVTNRPVADFTQAVRNARVKLNEKNEVDFERAVDIRRARFAGVTPLAAHHVEEASKEAAEGVAPAALPPEPDFGMLPGEVIDETPQTPQDRIDRWQRKLLDLTLRNRLLNFKDTKQTIPVLCPDLPGLEDMLADGSRFRVISLKDENPVGARDPELYQQQYGKDIHEEFAKDALERKQLCIDLTGNEMRNRLITLFRKANSELAEGGANTLYLAVGFLRWKKTENDPTLYRAPILLLPVSLKRRSANSDFYLAHHEDDIRINSTLLQFLQRDFGLRVSSLEGELPKDESGIDVPLVFSLMRQAVRDIPGFEVVEEAAFSTFSFAKYLMWKDLVDRTEDLRNNRLVKHLIDSPETPFAQACDGPCLPLPNEIDKKIPLHDLLTPLPADSSQLAAVVAAMNGHDFVVIGPPGTGKSQTIANMIAQCLSVGKRVLFVAEKSAALDVVYRRLKAYGLGDVCLELHSNKSDRKRVLAQLGAAWERSETYAADSWTRATSRLEEARDELNRYVEQLHAPGSHGFSVFQAIGIVTGHRPRFALTFDNLKAHAPGMFARLEETAIRADRIHTIVRDCKGFDSIDAEEWTFSWQNSLIEHAESILATIPQLKETADALAQKIGLPDAEETNLERIKQLHRFHEACRIASGRDYSKVVDAELGRLEEAAASLDAAITVIRQARANLTASYENAELKRIPVDDIDRQWREANAKMWPFSAFGRRRIGKLLQSYAAEGKVDVASEIVPLREIQNNIEAVDQSELAGLPVFQNEETDHSNVLEYLKGAGDLQQALTDVRRHASDAQRFGAALDSLLKHGQQQPDAERMATAFHSALKEFKSACEAYAVHSKGKLHIQSIESLETDLRHLIAHKTQLADWVRWVAVREEARALGLDPFLKALRTGQIENAKLDFRVAYFHWWLPLVIDASSELCGFRHWSHEDLIREFRKRDEAVQKMASDQVLIKTAHGLPARDKVAPRSELGALRHQLTLQRPSLSIRRLLESTPTVFTKLAPCMLMSPLSVAQYLPADQTQFDVVIFDEASQITTWDAVGAIARAEQSIIVGDPKQLPPTNFFGRTDDEDEEDLAEYEKDLPSILEEASAAGLPEVQLNWHYRSRDESLISFSNHHYYGGRLITFPSPKTESDALVFHKNDGAYARGTGRTNITEAREIVQFARSRLEHWLQLPKESRPTLGVITFNIQQQELILNLFDEARRSNPKLEWFFSENREEPVIVKNLENIQGDERDIMCFSITFGRDNGGKMSMFFGALNRDGGERRLNVAVTRARAEMHVFSSIEADDIDTSRTKALGVAHLKTFLDYAKRGPIALPCGAGKGDSVGDAESPFEEAVMSALQDKGWEIRPQIGVSDYRIDLGVVHPDHAGAYLAGVECDGATYHSSASARDRDKIREAVLCNLGWNIIRIWSTDWFMNPAEALKRVHTELKELLENSRQKEKELEAQAKEQAEQNEEWREVPEELVAETMKSQPEEEHVLQPRISRQVKLPNVSNELELPYSDPEPPDQSSKYAKSTGVDDSAASSNVSSLEWPVQPNADRFFDAGYTPILCQLIDYLVEIEGPIEADRLARTICKAHGWKRTGANIRQQINTCLGNNELRKEGKATFVWSPGTYQEKVPYRSIEGRAVTDISRHELFGLIADHPELVMSKDRVRDLADILGVKRLSQKVNEYLGNCLSTYFMR